MVNTHRVAVVNCIEQLKEYILDEVVVSEVSTVMEDLREQVAVRAVIHDDPGIVLILDDTMESDDTRMP